MEEGKRFANERRHTTVLSCLHLPQFVVSKVACGFKAPNPQRPRLELLIRIGVAQHFGSVRAVQEADAIALGAVLTKPQTQAVLRHFEKAATRS